MHSIGIVWVCKEPIPYPFGMKCIEQLMIEMRGHQAYANSVALDLCATNRHQMSTNCDRIFKLNEIIPWFDIIFRFNGMAPCVQITFLL